MALIREGALVNTSSGLIDAHSQVARRVNPPLRQKATSTSEAPKKGVQHLKVIAPEPDIFFASGIDRSYFVKEPRLRQKGIYLALYGRTVYVDRSGDTACRIAWGAHLRRNGLPDRIIAAVDKQQLLSEAQARTAERLAARMVIKHPGLTLINALPAGDRLASGPYMANDRFGATFFERIEQAGVLDPVAPAAGPFGRTNPGPFEPEPLEAAPDGQGEGQHLIMESCGVTAQARIADGKFWVLAGSQVQLEPVPSAGSAALKERQDLLPDGGLVREGNHLVLTVDVGLDTPSGAANFVAGSRVKPELWRPMADARGMDPETWGSGT
ncbi:DUF4357 domain-containing protein [uncultured Devosia sp.]|uniref:DUF4357 domain-containing protein n=1 Tax=uncultured Devosia sp. TaxID=211434 RepID=UPI002622F864|nr:DUF4357 domain-containing protein [uncultured Devosia sp.]